MCASRLPRSSETSEVCKMLRKANQKGTPCSQPNSPCKTPSKAGIAIPAFNIPYLPMMQPVIQALVDQDAFGLVEVARPEWIKFQAKSLAAVMEEFVKWQRPGYVRIHLDHVPVIDEDGLAVNFMAVIREAIALGYQSAMVDGSRLSLADNIAATRQVAELAHSAGIPCEAELGAVLGHETGPLPPYEELFASGKGFTDVEEARRFAVETGCDWLSVAVGSIHGAISGVAKDQKKVEARLNLEHLTQATRSHGPAAGTARRLRHPARQRIGGGQAGNRQDQHRHGNPPGLRAETARN